MGKLHQQRRRRGRLRYRFPLCLLVAQLALSADAGPLLAADGAPPDEPPAEASDHDSGRLATGTPRRWSLSVPLFSQPTGADVGFRLSDRLEFQGSVDASIEDSQRATVISDYDYQRSGQSLAIRLGLFWSVHRSGKLRFWLGPEVGFVGVDLEGAPYDPDAIDPGILEMHKWFARLYGGVELNLFKGLSAITYLKTPAVTHQRLIRTGVFAFLGESEFKVEIDPGANLSLRPELALRVRF